MPIPRLVSSECYTYLRSSSSATQSAGPHPQVSSRFRAFGPRITLDYRRSRGTGFACFWNLEDADKVVQQSDILRAETTGQSTVIHLLVWLTQVSCYGRTLDVVRAVTRDVAGKLKEDNDGMREKAYLYLLRGVIMPNTSSAELLTSADVERRTSSFNARRALLM